MTIENYIWDQIQADFKKAMPASQFQIWFSNASLKQITPSQAVIEVPNKFIADWLQDNYTDQIRTIFRDNLKTHPEVHFTYADPSNTIKRETEEDLNTPSLPPVHGIDSMTTFGDFVTADSNRLAYSSALSVTDKPATNYNPLYIFTELSLGKTHILNAIGNMVLQNNPCANILYLSADRFVNEFSSTTEAQESDRFWERENGPDFLLLDDIHLIAPHRNAQAQLLALCSSFLESSRQLVVTATQPPGQIPNLLPQLRSRLEWGLIAEIHPPGQRTKVKIIKKAAKNEKLFLPDDVSFYLANTTDNLNTLIHNVARLKEEFSTHKRPIDISSVESIIKRDYPSSYIDINHIQGVTAKYFNISLSDLLSDKRGKAFSYPRQVAIYLSKKLTSLSLKEIGHAFGNKHHSTVIYAENRIQQSKSQNKGIFRDIDNIQRLLS